MLAFALTIIIADALLVSWASFKLVSLVSDSTLVRVLVVAASAAICSIAIVGDAMEPALLLLVINDGGRWPHWLGWMMATGGACGLLAFLQIRLKGNWWGFS